MIKTIKLARKMLHGSAALQVLALMGAGTIAVGLAAPATAQDVTAGSITGIVRDEAGKPIEGAQVVLRSTDRGFERNVSTNGQGQFSAAALPIGPYEATISAANYQSARTDGIISQLGGASYNFTLAAATGTDSDIVVTATVQRAIDFSSTATGQVFNVQETAATLPVGRNIAAIQLLAPQAIPGDVNFNTANTSGVSLGGSSVAENIYYINGMNVTNFRTFVGGTTVPFEFYDSAVVKTGGYQAEFGRNTGGAVIAVSRSGTNEYRGGFNLYYTPDWARKDAPNTYSANNSLDQRANIEGNIWASGPIIKDHLFFFGFFNPRNLYTQDTSRAETFNSTGTVSNGFSNNTLVKTFQSTPFYGGKIDLNVIDSQRLEFTYFNDSTNVLTKQTVLANNTTASNRSFSGGSNFIGKYTGDFTDWLTVSALYGQSNFNQTTAGSDDNIPYTLDGRSGTLIYVAGNPAGLIEAGRDRRENFRGDIDLTFSLLGSHKLRFGGDYEKLRSDASTRYSGGTFYRYFRTGANATTVNQVAVPANTDYVRARTYNSGGSFETKNTAFYIQDSWDVLPQLNLNLGVRYDKFENFNASGKSFTKLDNRDRPAPGLLVRRVQRPHDAFHRLLWPLLSAGGGKHEYPSGRQRILLGELLLLQRREPSRADTRRQDRRPECPGRSGQRRCSNAGQPGFEAAIYGRVSARARTPDRQPDEGLGDGGVSQAGRGSRGFRLPLLDHGILQDAGVRGLQRHHRAYRCAVGHLPRRRQPVGRRRGNRWSAATC